ncbi:MULTISPECIES: HlyD family efflux transporter periplasmic adaptor subunit [Burkholderia]|uniref:Secretion protein HlyD n=1 Tax=Burkholderia aenigmatica TaxID=2015348 RepID=A0A228I8H0_9BURK|nr:MULTISPECIES: HlyD family efflux transporter periplasmic adaptor subunit [Burkholderia]MBN3841423.1 HlyD family efflux transporter periplasmic adaptor subunit [Burkholderia sp. Ac-20349]OXI38707.1 secretion protein HlyD [Burkholderia aenigmatica]
MERITVTPRLARFGFVFACLSIAGCTKHPETFQGYMEGQFSYLSTPHSGTLKTLPVRRGQRVAAGAAVFEIDSPDLEKAVKRQYHQWQSSLNMLEDLEKGKRPSEIDTMKAQLEQARATAARSSQRLARAEVDYGVDAISREKLEGERAAARVDNARVREIASQLRTAKLPARDDQLRSRRQDTEALQAEYERVEVQYGQRIVRAPENGVVVDTFFTPGEWVPAGNPVVKVLIDRNTKVRFFVPETRLARLRIGDIVKLGCDGCKRAYSATIVHIASEAEYTPPVIYSNDVRAKLVFLVEAQPDDVAARTLHPGMPVEVTP